MKFRTFNIRNFNRKFIYIEILRSDGEDLNKNIASFNDR